MMIKKLANKRYTGTFLKRLVSLTVASLFLMNELALAGPLTEGSGKNSADTLQVQSLFRPIVEQVGEEYAASVNVEMTMIMAMVLKDSAVPFQDINAELDKWCGKAGKRERILDVLPSGTYKSDGKVVVPVNILAGPNKGTRLELSSNCLTLKDLAEDGARIRVKVSTDIFSGLDMDPFGASKDLGFMKVVPMEIGQARKAAQAQIIYTSRMTSPEQKKQVVDRVIKEYQEDTPDFIVDYADGIDRSKDEMIIIKEIGGPILGFISYGKTGDGLYKVYYHYVFRQERDRRVGRNLIGEMMSELSKRAGKEGPVKVETKPLTYNGENLWTAMFGKSAIKQEKRGTTGETVRRAYVDLGKNKPAKAEPILAKQPILNDSFVVTIDGPSGTGKSTSATEVAKRLGAVFFSYGKMYRLITWMALNAKLKPGAVMSKDTLSRLVEIAAKIDMKKFRTEDRFGKYHYYYEDSDITDIFYSEDIAANVPYVAGVPEVRRLAVRKIREMITSLRQQGVSVVLEGRVSGIEIAPDADVRIYMTAKPEVRAERRVRQMVDKDGLKETYREVFKMTSEAYETMARSKNEREQRKDLVRKIAESIEQRDKLDRERKHMPAIAPKGALVLDSSDQTFEQTVAGVVDLIEATRIRKLVERNMELDDEAVKRLDAFYKKYRELVRKRGSGSWFKLSEELEDKYLNPERIADLFYLSEKYKFDIWDLAGKSGKTSWIKETPEGKIEYVFRVEKGTTVVMEKPSVGGVKPEEIGKATERDYGVKDLGKYGGQNIGNFIIKAHYFILWANESRSEADVEIMWSAAQSKLVEYYQTIGLETGRDFDGDMRARAELFGGLDAGMITPAEAARLKGLDPRVWRVWSQRNLDRYLSLVEQVPPDRLEAAQKAFSETHKDEKIEQLRAVSPGTVANFILLSYTAAESQRKQRTGETETEKILPVRAGPGKFSPLAATEDLYALKGEADRNAEEILKNEASGIEVDEATGKLRYFKAGKAFVPVKAHVYVKEGERWELPEGVELPAYLGNVINNNRGALVLTTGPFYDKIKNAPNDSYVRPLTDEEVYKMFGLRRVYDKEGKEPFTVQALGIAGRSMLLPVAYTITTVPTAEGKKIALAGDNRKAAEKRKVFGLEFKNCGTPAYEEHNKNRAFPATVTEEYVGKPGIFLPWEHQLGAGNPVGLGDEYGTTIPREQAALGTGAGLSRWVLATIPLKKKFRMVLRAPVGDYRRLGVFFDGNGRARPEVFKAVMKEMGETAQEYLPAMARNYGKNMRAMIENNIMESEHGSIINSDILGNITDLGDFWEISGNEKFLQHGVEIRIDNLIKVLDLAGKEKKELKDQALREFAKAFFGAEVDADGIKISAQDPKELKERALEFAHVILRDVKKRQSLEKPKERAKPAVKKEEAGKKGEDKVRETIRGTNSKSVIMFAALEKYAEKLRGDKAYAAGAAPVNIVVDLSLIPGTDKEDMENNVSTWAHLIIMCGKLGNVHFTFKNMARADKAAMPAELADDIDNAADEAKVAALLKAKMKEASVFFGPGMDAERIFSERVNTQGLKNPIEIPIVSKGLLEWMRDTSRELGADQFPVAMDGPSAKGKKEAVLRNFEAALTIGLSKAVLAAAKRRGKGVPAGEEAEMRKAMDETRMLTRLQALYDVLFNGKVRITENTLMNMIYEDSRMRINQAISLAIPPVTRMAIRELQELHGAIQDLLRAA